MIESAITKKGQTTLPKPVREVLGVRVGDRVRYVIFKGEVRILPVRPGQPAVRRAAAWFGHHIGGNGAGHSRRGV